MKKILFIMLILFLFLVPNISAVVRTITADSGWTTFPDTPKIGYLIKTNSYNLFIQNFTKTASSNANTAYILHANFTVIKQVSFSGNFADFTEVELLGSGRLYYIMIDSGGASYTGAYRVPSSYPIALTDAEVTTAYLSSANTTGNDVAILNVGMSNASLLGPIGNISVTLNSPVNNTQIITSTTQFFNVTVNYNTFELTNTTIYFWFSNGTTWKTQTNTSFSPENYSTYNLSSWINGDFYWNVLGRQGNSNGGNSSFATNNFSLSVRPFNILNQTYNTPVIEQSTQNFQTTLTLESGYALSTVLLNYNSTNYTGFFSAMNSTTYNLTASVITPAVVADINKTFYWIINLTDGSSFQSSSNTQLVLDLSIDGCSVNTIRIINSTIVNEETQTRLSGTGDTTSIKITVELYSNVSLNSYAFNFSKWYNQTLPAEVCISNSIANSTFFMNSIIEYDASGFAREFYHIQNYSLNTSGGDWQNITLYDLNDTQNQNFKVVYKDESFLPVSNALIQVQRKYIDENVFKTVEIPRTDTNGETVAHLQIADAVYTFSVVKNGKLLSTFNDVRAVCANQVIGDCTINLNTFASSLDTGDFTQLTDFAFTISYDNTTRTISGAFTVPSGATATVLLNVTANSPTGLQQVCSNSLSTSSGTVSCAVPSTYGNQTVIASIYKNGDFQGRAFIKLDQHPTTIYTVVLVFLSIFMMLTLIGIGVSSDPKITGVFLIMGAILSILLNLVTSIGVFGAGATVLWLVIAIMLVLIKSTKR